MTKHPIVKEVQSRMDKTIEAIHHELSKIRSGRATPELLDPVKVEAYGGKMPLNQVATVTTPEARMIIVQPWDKTLMSVVEKAIMQADLGLNPSNDGNIIRIPIPPLNEDRRRDLVKICGKVIEEGKISLRNIRRDGNDQFKEIEKNHDLPEDEIHKHLDEIQNVTDNHVKDLDDLLKRKEAEIMEV